MAGKGPMRAKSIRALAGLVGRAESTVRKWIGRDDWPFSLSPPWEVGRVKAWAEIHLNPDPAAAYRKRAKAADAGTGEFRDVGPLQKVRIQKGYEQILEIRARRLRDAGELHDVGECRRRRVRILHAFKSAMQEFPATLAHRLVGLGAEEIEALLAAEVRNALGTLAQLPEETP